MYRPCLLPLTVRWLGKLKQRFGKFSQGKTDELWGAASKDARKVDEARKMIATRDTPSRHIEPIRRLWVEPLCGSAPIELLEAVDDELGRERAEAIRGAYVAATRARDLLVVTTCGDQPLEGWLECALN